LGGESAGKAAAAAAAANRATKAVEACILNLVDLVGWALNESVDNARLRERVAEVEAGIGGVRTRLLIR
jgi:hypothetical protein